MRFAHRWFLMTELFAGETMVGDMTRVQLTSRVPVLTDPANGSMYTQPPFFPQAGWVRVTV